MDFQGLGISGVEAQVNLAINLPESRADAALQDTNIVMNSNTSTQSATASRSSRAVEAESNATVASTASFSWMTGNDPQPDEEDDCMDDNTKGEDEVIGELAGDEGEDDDGAWPDGDIVFSNEDGEPVDEEDMKKSGIKFEYLETPPTSNLSPGEQMRQMEERVVAETLREMEREREIEVLKEDDKVTFEELAATGVQPDDATLIAHLEGKDDDVDQIAVDRAKRCRLGTSGQTSTLILRKQQDFFSALSQYPELFFELAKQLRIAEFISLYAISKDFHETINGHLAHVMKTCAAYQAPESSRIFVFSLYSPLCVPDPAGRPNPEGVNIPRMVPSLKWLHMVNYRERAVRDILACLARDGHRTPKTMSLTLKKMWLTMDIATSARRVQFMHNEKYWTDDDIFNVQLFVIKLDMMFNDPYAGPGDDGLRKLMLGQKGLGPLCKLLKRERYTDTLEILEAAVRYSYTPKEEHRSLPIFGVPPDEVGRGHLEGWGLGRVHLYRPDELVMRESCRRNLRLERHVMNMMFWGYVDKKTGENIKVTDDEMYMSDDEDLMRRYEKEVRRRKEAGLDPPEVLLSSQDDIKIGKGKSKEEGDFRNKDEVDSDVNMQDIDDIKDEDWETDDEDY